MQNLLYVQRNNHSFRNNIFLRWCMELKIDQRRKFFVFRTDGSLREPNRGDMVDVSALNNRNPSVFSMPRHFCELVLWPDGKLFLFSPYPILLWRIGTNFVRSSRRWHRLRFLRNLRTRCHPIRGIMFRALWLIVNPSLIHFHISTHKITIKRAKHCCRSVVRCVLARNEHPSYYFFMFNRGVHNWRVLVIPRRITNITSLYAYPVSSATKRGSS